MLATLALLLVPAACAPQGAGRGYGLFAHLELAEELVLGADESWAREAAERMAPRLAAELGLRVSVRPLGRARVGGRQVRLLLGYPDSPELARALRRMGVDIVAPGRVRIGAREFGGPAGGALVATLPDPRRGDAPLTVFAALEEHDPTGWAHVDLDIARALRPTWRTGWQVFDGTGLVVAQGALDRDGRAVATVDPPLPEVSARSLAEWLELDPDLPPLELDRRAALERVRAVLGPSPTLEGFEPQVRIHRRPEDLALRARGWSAYRCAPASGVVDLVVAPGLFVDARAAFAELYARRGARDPRAAWMVEGLARNAAQSWWGRELGGWCAHLQRAGLVPPLEELVAPASDLSPHVVAPLRGLLFEVLLATRGVDEVRRLWHDGGLELGAPLRAAFEARLAGLVRQHEVELDGARRARRTQVLARPFRRGVALVPALERGDPLDSGLGSAAGRLALERIAALGADALSLDVAAYVEPAWAPRALQPRRGPPAQITDLELAAACAGARERDLDVLLKPQLWMAPGSTLAGEVLLHTSGQWRLFFDTYERVLTHYALLAELADVEIVSVGSELRNAAVTFRDRGDTRWGPGHFEWKRARWDAVLARLRAAFGGGLTYAARWDEPLESISFWERLDFVGLDLFPPLAGPDERRLPPGLRPIARRLERALQRAETSAGALGKRLLIVEVGFPSTRDAWSAPDRPRGPADEGAQGLFLSGLAMQRRSWDRPASAIAGLYVWCWSTEPDGGPAGERDYTLQGKRGVQALERAFQEP